MERNELIGRERSKESPEQLAQALYEVRHVLRLEGLAMLTSIINSSHIRHPVVKEVFSYIDNENTPKEGGYKRLYQEGEYLKTLDEREKEMYFESQRKEKYKEFRKFLEKSIEQNLIEDSTEKKVLRTALVSLYTGAGGNLKKALEYLTNCEMREVMDFNLGRTNEIRKRINIKKKDLANFAREKTQRKLPRLSLTE